MIYSKHIFAGLSVMACTWLISCGFSNKVPTSQPTATEQNASFYPWNMDVVDYEPFPPEDIEKKFGMDYPLAIGISWSLEMTHGTKAYKVNFTLDDKKNWVVYAENGHTLESREQILPDSLPPAVPTAIKTKFPNAQIISAFDVRSSRAHGTYAVLIHTTAPNEEREVVLTAQGKFVK